MKIRTSFVSNSSTASFIIRRKTVLEPDGVKLTRNQIRALNRYGFKKTEAQYPDQVDNLDWTYDLVYAKKNKMVNEYNYGYSVICNQSEVIAFLLKHRIPFVADEHYDQYTLVYDGGDSFVRYYNFGQLILMKCETLKSVKKSKKYEIVNREDYIKTDEEAAKRYEEWKKEQKKEGLKYD